jgi:presenilin-like A22 family membrane protease
VIEQSYNITGITEPPPVRDDSYAFLFIGIAVLIGTGIVLLIIKFRQRKLWKTWFYLSVIVTLMMAFSPFIEKLLKYLQLMQLAQYTAYITLIIVCILGYFKVFKPNLYVHNFTELFIYGGLASILVPVLNITSVVVLLVLISLYDAYAVWKSKHMIKMAEFQTDSNLFAGLMIPKKQEAADAVDKPMLVEEKNTAKKEAVITTITGENSSDKNSETAEKQRSAILGGGDIAFPMLFAGTIFKYAGNWFDPVIIIIITTISLLLLFLYGDKNKYYPAMPILTAGCFIGWGIVLLIRLV